MVEDTFTTQAEFKASAHVTYFEFGQIHFVKWTNIYHSREEDIFTVCEGEHLPPLWTNMFVNMDKYIWQFAQIHFAYPTNIYTK